MRPGFASPASMMQAIKVCLDPLANRIHLGSLGSGMTLNCCEDDKVLRIESAGARAPEGAQPLARHGCRTIVVDVAITYAACFASHTRDGGERSLTDLTVDGMNQTNSWWHAFQLLACCGRDPETMIDAAQLIRFVSISERPPEGQCAEWTMTVEADVYTCSCHGAWGEPEVGL